MKTLKFAAAAVLALGITQAHAVPVTKVVMKVSDLAGATAPLIDPFNDWINAGGFNEGVAGAASLTNNGVDYKDSWVDTNWGMVHNVRVSMYSQGQEVAYLEFDPTGTTKSNFFDLSNLTSSTWGTTGFPGQDLVNPFGTGQFFRIEGSDGNNRHWYVNNNWGGCSVDRGWFVVLDKASGYVCNWENTGVVALGNVTRGFMYSTRAGLNPTHQNFNEGTIGIADVFAVSVTYDDGTVTRASEPAALAIFGLGLVGLSLAARRKRKTA